MEPTDVTAQSIFDDSAADLKLPWVADLEGADRMSGMNFTKETTSVANLVGHLNLTHPNRVQVFGRPKITYYRRLSEENHRCQMGELILLEPPFLVVADGAGPPPNLEPHYAHSSTSLFTSPISSTAVIDHLRPYLSRILTPCVTTHGVFLDILGMGVLIMDDSGLDKNELGLELISRGHGLVADNIVDFVQLGPDFIEGRYPPLLRNLLEVRGLGLPDIKIIFGETAVCRKMKIRLIVQLVCHNGGEFERLPFDSWYLDMLGLPIHMMKIQVTAGHNSVVLTGVAVRNTILRLRGIDTLRDFMDRQ